MNLDGRTGLKLNNARGQLLWLWFFKGNTMNEFWDLRYNAREYVYGTRPNEFFKDILRDEKPGRLLLAGEGEGRNAVYAASLGWEVHAFDFSMVAKKKALELAFLRGVQIRYRVCSWQDYSAPGDTFDLAGVFFFQLAGAGRRLFHRRLAGWVKPGGRIVAEVFSQEQNGRESGGPKNPDFLYSTDMLRDDFRTMKIHTLRETEVNLDEGIYHQGKAKVIRFNAEKNGAYPPGSGGFPAR